MKRKILGSILAVLLIATVVYAASWKTTDTEDSSIDGSEIVMLENGAGTGNNWASLTTIKTWVLNGLSAASVAIVDAGDYLAAENVETGIQELAAELADKLDAGDVVTVSSDVETMLGSANNAAIISNIGAQPAIDTENVETSGILQGKMLFNSYTAAQTLTFADHNASVVQMTTADEVTMWDCETAGVGAFVMLWARDAEKIEVVPASGDHFNLFNGTALTANNELDIAATAGTKVTLMCTADDTWSVYSETAASTDGGAAD